MENSGFFFSLFNVIVMSGILFNWVCISWEYNGVGVFEFLVYCDEELIVNFEFNEFFFNDSEGVFGRFYVYMVRVRVNGIFDVGKFDVGFFKGNG